MLRLGDMVFDHLAARPGMAARLHALREENRRLDALFEFMMRHLRDVYARTDAWWFGAIP